MKNIMNPKLSTKIIQRGLWMGALLLSAAAASAQTPLTFQVDMSNFTIPAGDTVSVNGAFDGWSANHTLTNNSLGASPNLYSGTVANTSVAGGAVMDYQYRLIEANGSTVDNYSSQADGDNYCATIPASGPLALPYQYWSDDGTAVSNSISFTVDMAEQLNTGAFLPQNGNTVYCQGSFEGWNDNFQLTNNPALNVTNNGNVISMPYQGTFTTWAASPGAAAEYKFVYNNGSDVYESPTSGDPDNGQNRFFFNEAQTVPKVWFSDIPWVPNVTNQVTFIVDMSVQAGLNNFSVANGNSVELHGTIFNNWGGGTTMSNSPSDPDLNHFYTTATLVGGPGLPGGYFQYVIQPATEWESAVGNRTAYLGLTSGPITNGPVYWNNAGPSSLNDDVSVTNCMVTFTVDMTPAINAGIFFAGASGYYDVYINGIFNGIDGSWWPWPAEEGLSQYQMNEIGSGNLYTITIPVNDGQPLQVVYKYGINGSDDESGVNDNHSRYIRSLPNYTMPTDEWGGQGSTTSTEPSLANFSYSRSGSTLNLQWLGRTGVHLQTTTSLTPPIAWTPLPLSDGTNLVVTPGNELQGIAPGGALTTNVTTSYPIGSGNLYYELIGP